MHPRDFKKPLLLVRVAVLLRYVAYIESVGAPVERLLARSGIPAVLLGSPMALVPQEKALRFIDLACRCLGTEHVGLYVGLAFKLDNLGSYGQMLQRSLTLHQYFQTGIAFYNTMVAGQRIWLTEHGEDLRFHVANLNQAGGRRTSRKWKRSPRPSKGARRRPGLIGRQGRFTSAIERKQLFLISNCSMVHGF